MKKIILLLATIFIVLTASAQSNKTMQEMFMSKTWRWGDVSKLCYDITFTQDSIIYIINGAQKHNYKGFNTKNTYYFSDTNDKKFIESKVGIKQSGRYLVRKNLTTMEIISVTDKQIKLGNINNGDGKGIIYYDAID